MRIKLLVGPFIFQKVTTMQDNYYNQSCQEIKTLALLMFLEINLKSYTYIFSYLDPRDLAQSLT
jgi:hypothetical protein